MYTIIRNKNFSFLILSISENEHVRETHPYNLENQVKLFQKLFITKLYLQNYGSPPILENRKFASYWSTKRITYPKEIFAEKRVDG